MKTTIQYFLIGFFTLNIVCGQPIEPGAKAAALGGSFVTQYSVFSSKHNVAGLAFAKSNGIAFGARNNFLINDLNDFYLLGCIKLSKSTIGFDFSYYGFDAFQQGEIGISYAQKINVNWSAGARISYSYNYLPDESISRNLVSADLGISGKIDNWRIGASIARFAQSQWIGQTKEQEPMVFRIGIGYYFSHALISTEIYKASYSKVDFRLGMSYAPADILDIRIGFSTINPSMNFGIGLQFKTLQINLAAAWHSQLGLSPVTDLVYEW